MLSICQLHILQSRTAQISLELHFCVELHTRKVLECRCAGVVWRMLQVRRWVWALICCASSTTRDELCCRTSSLGLRLATTTTLRRPVYDQTTTARATSRWCPSTNRTAAAPSQTPADRRRWRQRRRRHSSAWCVKCRTPLLRLAADVLYDKLCDKLSNLL